jgi:uncharacterized protein YkwD
MFKDFITLTVLLLLTSSVFSQRTAPVIWEEPVHDLGIVSEGASYTVVFKFTNIGKNQIVVDNIRTNCRCIIPFWEDRAISPGTKGELTLTYNVDKAGIFNKGIYVTFQNYKTAEVIQIKATTDNIEYGLLAKKTEEEEDREEVDLPKINTESITAKPPGMRNKEDVSTMIPGQPNRKKPKVKEEDIPAIYETDIANRQPAKGFPYMTIREKEMIDEINLLRGNPSGYVPFVQEYIMSMEKEIQKDPSMANMYLEEISTAYELVKALRVTDPLPILKPHEGVYDAAKIHGADLRENTQFGHIGSDGSYPWDRIIKFAPDLSDGNENLVGGPYEIRQAVILLLVDSGIPDRGHRKTLLNPHWNFVACHELGQVGTMPNCWIQNFGKK